MSDAPTRYQAEQSLRQHAERLATITAQFATKKPGEPGTMDYIRARVLAAGSLIDEVAKADLSAVNYDMLQGLVGHVSALPNVLQAMTALAPGTRNENFEKVALAEAEAASGRALPIVAYIAGKDQTALTRLEAEIRQHRDLANELAMSLHNQVEEVEKMRGRGETALAALQKSAAEAGVSTNATEFSALADGHEMASRRWLTATVAVTIVLIGALVGLIVLIPLKAGDTTPVVVQYVLTRTLGFAALSFAAVWASRNYRAHRHLAVLNRHRHKALVTFQTFAVAAKDDATKNAVLLEATRCIFAAGATGYSGADPDPSPAQVIEIVKSFTGK
jgi:hypothetical protein